MRTLATTSPRPPVSASPCLPVSPGPPVSLSPRPLVSVCGTTLPHGRVKLLASGLFKARPWHRITVLKRLN